MDGKVGARKRVEHRYTRVAHSKVATDVERRRAGARLHDQTVPDEEQHFASPGCVAHGVRDVRQGLEHAEATQTAGVTERILLPERRHGFLLWGEPGAPVAAVERRDEAFAVCGQRLRDSAARRDECGEIAGTERLNSCYGDLLRRNGRLADRNRSVHED